MSQLTLRLYPDLAGLRQGTHQDRHVLARIQAGPRPASAMRRPRLDLALVIDRSGSMAGRPLEEARRCAHFIIDALLPDDRVAIVAYDHEVRVAMPAVAVGNRREHHAAIESLEAGGCTALYDGWATGAAQLAAIRDEAGHGAAGLSRVLLLSDGQANEGQTDPAVIAQACGEYARRGITTSTYGLAHAFNEDLMIAMAREGGGNAYYGKTAADLHGPFLEEFELLQALCAREVHLHLSGPDGVAVELGNDYVEPVRDTWRLPDLAWDAEGWALARVAIPRRLTEGVAVDVLTALVSWVDLDGCRHESGPVTLSLPCLNDAAFAALRPNPRVMRRREELDAARRHREVRQAALNDDWQGVDLMLAEARHELAGNPWLAKSLDVLGDLAAQRDAAAFSKEAAYRSVALSSRLVAASEDSDSFDPAAEANLPTYLRRKLEEGSDRHDT